MEQKIPTNKQELEILTRNLIDQVYKTGKLESYPAFTVDNYGHGTANAFFNRIKIPLWIISPTEFVNHKRAIERTCQQYGADPSLYDNLTHYEFIYNYIVHEIAHLIRKHDKGKENPYYQRQQEWRRRQTIAHDKKFYGICHQLGCRIIWDIDYKPQGVIAYLNYLAKLNGTPKISRSFSKQMENLNEYSKKQLAMMDEMIQKKKEQNNG